MKQLLWAFGATLLCVACTSNSETVEGSITCAGKAIPNVVVTDGYNFTQSDSQGHYKMAVADSALFVSIVTPAGYVTDFSDGVPNFYHKLSDEQSDYDFDLNKWGDSTDYTLFAIGDIQTATQQHLDEFATEVYPDIKGYVVSQYMEKGVNPVLITLGDIGWDSLDIYDNYQEVIKTLPAPLYPVIGNHDHDKAVVGDIASEHIYNDTFGPSYYAFNLGSDYFMVLDNIIYDTQKRYDEGVDKRQQEWMRNYLTYLPKGANVYICMHSPLIIGDLVMDPSYSEWVGLFAEYNLKIISGHTHQLFNKETVEGVFEHNIGAACGAWWTSETGRDGAPKGYQIFESRGGKPAQWQFKSVGHDMDYQMKLYGAGVVDSLPNSVVAHIWAIDDEWQVKGWFDGKEVEGVRATLNDPYYESYAKEKGYRSGDKSDGYVVFDIPKGADRFQIEATDRFGHKYKESLEL